MYNDYMIPYYRRSIRLKNYDYSQTGAYFVTICAQEHKCIFGEIVNKDMKLNKTGRLVEKWWLELKNKFKNIQLDNFIIMPNHLHGIIIINPAVGADLCVRPNNNNNNSKNNKGDKKNNQGGHAGPPLQTMIQWFKTMSMNEYIKNVKQNNWETFDRKIWQRSFYEHIIRNEEDLNKIREYIIFNSINWDDDDENIEKI